MINEVTQEMRVDIKDSKPSKNREGSEEELIGKWEMDFEFESPMIAFI